ncbi:putative bifunctional diguanylate cyclase/phosphodiesterase [Pseudidiomarina terrestris]|uniref:putative bifunctional diguanylate cyclase/phosphodiesterase n=1 Tax=Pseudidiomarina terrestris TaxID=2820060 RepID=UPI00264E1457|nr:bifunctional diguanylate cyclase/phosphodiesterase [Pseudidiomarina sp. 1ASP75-5]MDN7134984.1 bifunctional diguanylate cyclase/phosphodiesterase [Pseudidiomarina sp. 1ASP75-5]
MIRGRWLLLRKLLLIAVTGIVLTILAAQVVLHSENKAIAARLSEDTRQLEEQFRQVLLTYAFATEWTARSLAREPEQQLQTLADEANALFLYYPSLQRILVLNHRFEPVFSRAAKGQPVLGATEFSDTPIASKLAQQPLRPHAQSALAGSLAEAPEDIVLAAGYSNTDEANFLTLVVDIHRLFDDLVRSEITEGYQVEISMDSQAIYRFAGTDELRAEWAVERPLKFASNEWQLHLWPTRERLDAMYSASVLLVLFGGVLLSLGGLFLGWRSHLLQQRLHARQQLVKHATQQLRHMHDTEDRLLFLSDHDALTELPNRNGLLRYLEQQLAEAQQQSSPLAVMVISIDSFRELNHALGHLIGDEIIKRIALRIQKALPVGAFIARTSTESFVVVTSSADDNTNLALAESIRHSVTPQLFIEQHEIYCSASIGIAYASDADYETDSILYNADSALYSARQQGYFGIEFYHSEQQLELKQRRQRLQALRLALESEQLELYYQPVVQLRQSSIVGVEVLLRWRTPNGELIEPRAFLELMEQTGLIFSITDFIFKTACQQLALWQKEQQRSLTISINLSLRQLTMPELPELVTHYRKRAQLSAESIQLEFDESVYLQLCRSHKVTVEQLKQLGMRVCVNVTGVSNSLLEAIRYCPPHVLKIAPELIAEMPNQAVPTELVESIIRLAHNLRLQVIAVAVEEQQQVDFLLQRNCVLAQGHYLAPALPVDKLTALLQQPFTVQQQRPSVL